MGRANPDLPGDARHLEEARGRLTEEVWQLNSERDVLFMKLEQEERRAQLLGPTPSTCRAKSRSEGVYIRFDTGRAGEPWVRR